MSYGVPVQSQALGVVIQVHPATPASSSPWPAASPCHSHRTLSTHVVSSARRFSSCKTRLLFFSMSRKFTGCVSCGFICEAGKTNPIVHLKQFVSTLLTYDCVISSRQLLLIIYYKVLQYQYTGIVFIHMLEDCACARLSLDLNKYWR